MAFVKLDCGMLDSTLWLDRAARELFITALLMAYPVETECESRQIQVRSLEETGFRVPPGWYGFVPAAGSGIIHRSGMEVELGMAALERLGEVDSESRTPDFEGRRMIRVDGGYLVLNYDKYRQKDHTAAERSKRYREKQSSRVANVTSRVTSRSVTHAEAEYREQKENTPKPPRGPLVGFDEFWDLYPRKESKLVAERAWRKISVELHHLIFANVKARKQSDPQWLRDNFAYVPHPATYLNQKRWEDEFLVGRSVSELSEQEILRQAIE